MIFQWTNGDLMGRNGGLDFVRGQAMMYKQEEVSCETIIVKHGFQVILLI